MAVDIDQGVTPDKHATNGKIQTNGGDINGDKGRPEKPLMSPDQPLPHVAEVDFATAASSEQLIEDIVSSLRVSGGCIIRNMVGKDVLDQLETDIRPHLKAAKPAPGTSVLPHRILFCQLLT